MACVFKRSARRALGPTRSGCEAPRRANVLAPPCLLSRMFSNKATVDETKPVESTSGSKSHLLHSFDGISDDKIVEMIVDGTVSHYKLEKELKRSVEEGKAPDCSRAVRIRRLYVEDRINSMVEENFTDEATAASASKALNPHCDSASIGLPYSTFQHESFYRNVLGKNCENVIGFIPVPVGLVGPLLMDGKKYYVPMATTEGALLASTNRGCRAITESGGVASTILGDGMTRAPALRMPSAMEAAALANWVKLPETLRLLQEAFGTTTRFGRLDSVFPSVAGRQVHLRFKCFTGDAMGMNMISKGVLHCIQEVIEKRFPKVELLSLSGNMCTDKKPSAINWIEGRGKQVVAEVVLTSHVVVDVLKCTVNSLLDVNISKNLIGSALAGSIGGNNAHASNIVTACFIATGQDPAQNVESSNCMTLMEAAEGGGLRVSVTMPCLEVGTVGGGTSLAAQRACLDILGLAGSSKTPGHNAQGLARVIASTVLAGEISLISALASNHLVSAHMKLNRAEKPVDKKGPPPPKDGDGYLS